MKLNLSTYNQVFSLFRQCPILIVGLVLTSLLAIICEGLGIGLILPLLNDSPLQIDVLNKMPRLGGLVEFIGNITFTHRIQLVAVLLVLIVFVRNLFSYLSAVLAISLQINIENKLQKLIFKQILAVQISLIHEERQGSLLETLVRHSRQVGTLVLALANGLIHCFTILVYVSLALFVSWELTLIAVFLFLILVKLSSQGLSTRINQLSKKQQASGLQFMSTMAEELSALHLTHLFAQENRSLKCLVETQQDYYSYHAQVSKLIALSRPLLNVLSTLAIGLLLLAGTFLLRGQSEFWIGQTVLFIIIAFRLMTPVSALNQVKAQIDSLSPYLQSVLEFLRPEGKPLLKNGSTHFESLKTGILFENVTFKYKPNEDKIIKNVTIEIPKGKMTAVVGPSGSGKSTLVHLLTRLDDPGDGSILVDGTDLRQFDITSWRSQLAVISQDVFLFKDTVQANLKFAKPTASDEEMFHAARLAQAHDFITNLPEGYDTMLGDRGVRLSGGQQQRIAIARAILVDPQLLILDEATSDLDSKTERAFQDAIEQYCEGHTLLVIAHRLSTIRKADKIIVLDAGAVIEQGTHKELMLKRGHYWQLLQTQDSRHEALLV